MLQSIANIFAAGPAAPPLTDPAQIDATYRRHRLRVLIAITLGYGLIYTCRLAIGVVKKPLIDAGIFTPADLGLIGSFLFYGYAFGRISSGLLVDHANVKRFLGVGMLASALCNLGMGASATLWAACLFWGLNGWFQSFGAPGCVVAITQWFSNHERGRYYGIWSTSHALGEGLTFVAVGGIVAAFGWRAGYLAPAILGLVTAAFVYAWVQDRPRTFGLPPVGEWRGDQYESKAKPQRTLFLTQIAILRYPAVWAVACSSALIYVTRYAINSWGVLYLQEARGYSLPQAGSMLLISNLAGMAGAVAYGFLSDKVFAARRPPANLIFGVGELIGMSLIFYGPHNAWSLMLGMVLLGAGMMGLVTSLGGLFVTDICPKSVAGAALAVTGLFSYVGAAIQEQVSGLLIEHGMTVVNGVRHYDFSASIVFWMGASVASLVLATALWNTKLRD